MHGATARAEARHSALAAFNKLLTNTVYIGRWKFNQTSSKTGERKPDEEVVEIPVPAIISPGVFEHVQRQLHARNPKVSPPRVTTGPILLTGLAVCASCGGAMTLRTGTSKSGRIYRYYTCSSSAVHGKTVCRGRSVAMDKLDTLINSDGEDTPGMGDGAHELDDQYLEAG